MRAQSITVMCRRRPSGRFAPPWWADGADAAFLRPLILLGSWDAANDDDVALVEEYTGMKWDDLQKGLVNYINRDNAPLVREGQIWALAANETPFALEKLCIGECTCNGWSARTYARMTFQPMWESPTTRRMRLCRQSFCR